MKFFQAKNNLDTTMYTPDYSLTELANMYETDKGDAEPLSLSWGKDWPDHYCMGYTHIYEKYMKYSRTKENINFFEIGICDQRFPYASVKMWLSYFKNISLYCADIFWGTTIETKKQDINMLNNMGANIFYADQGSYSDWLGIHNTLKSGSIDFFVEDGSHWPNHMAYTLWQSIPLLKSGGFYFMEDLQNPINARGKYRYDNSLLTQNLIDSIKNKHLDISFLNNKQNQDINKYFELIELNYDSIKKYNYLAVFRKK